MIKRIRHTSFKLIAMSFVVASSLVISGCTEGIQYFASSFLENLEEEQPPSKISYPTRLYRIDFGHSQARKAVVFITGSGCEGLRNYLAPYLDNGISGEFTVFALEKPGVPKRSIGQRCTDEFRRLVTFDNLLEQNSILVDAISSGAYGEFEGISVFGVSEGAIIGSALSEYNDKVERVALVGFGGLSLIDSWEILFSSKRTFLDPKIVKERVANSDDPDELVYGNTVRYYRSILNVYPAGHLLASRSPVLAVMGEKDQHVPIESLHYLQSAFNKAGQSDRITTIQVNGANHPLVGENEDHKHRIFKTISEFLAE